VVVFPKSAAFPAAFHLPPAYQNAEVEIYHNLKSLRSIPSPGGTIEAPFKNKD
jgi:hypothetical protein